MKKALFLLLILMFIAGCGYHVAGKSGGKEFLPGVETVAIPMFENITGNAGVESIITSAVVDEFLNAVKVEGNADTVLKGVVKSYELKPVSFNKSDVVSEYRLSVVISVKLVKTPDGKVVWHDDNVSDYEDFTVNISDVSATKDAEIAALRKIAKDTARLLRERISAGF
ncbi:MAG: LptE family protein [Thermodesulfobacteriota bacterium]